MIDSGQNVQQQPELRRYHRLKDEFGDVNKCNNTYGIWECFKGEQLVYI